MGLEPIVRTLGEGDIARLATFYNDVYANYAGPATRTPEDLAWRVFRRPGVEAGGVFVAESADGIVGYASLRITGEVLEFAVDPSGEEGAVADSLVAAIEDYADEHGIEQISVNVPLDRPAVVESFRSGGYGVGNVEHLYLAIDDIAKLVLSRAPALTGVVEGTFRITIADHYPWQRPEVSFRVTAEDVSVTDDAPQLTISSSLADLTDVVFAGRDPTELLESAATVTPREAAPQATALLAALAVNQPWFWSRSDVI